MTSTLTLADVHEVLTDTYGLHHELVAAFLADLAKGARPAYYWVREYQCLRGALLSEGWWEEDRAPGSEQLAAATVWGGRPIGDLLHACGEERLTEFDAELDPMSMRAVLHDVECGAWLGPDEWGDEAPDIEKVMAIARRLDGWDAELLRMVAVELMLWRRDYVPMEAPE